MRRRSSGRASEDYQTSEQVAFTAVVTTPPDADPTTVAVRCREGTRTRDVLGEGQAHGDRGERRGADGLDLVGEHLAAAGYLISVSSLNIGRYMEMITMPTITPTPSIMIGSTIEVSAWTEASTSSS